jgi:hypothetical protein
MIVWVKSQYVTFDYTNFEVNILFPLQDRPSSGFAELDSPPVGHMFAHLRRARLRNQDLGKKIDTSIQKLAIVELKYQIRKTSYDQIRFIPNVRFTIWGGPEPL